MARRLIVLGLLVVSALLLLEGMGSGLKVDLSTSSDRFKRHSLPQVVVDQQISTAITLQNRSNAVCEYFFVLHEGAGQTASPVPLINGANRGPNFLSTLPPTSTTRLELTAPLSTTERFEGGAVVDVVSPGCQGALDVSAAYTINDNAGRLLELFSYAAPQPVPINGCATTAVDFDPDSGDGRISIPGLAATSLDPLTGVELKVDLLDPNGQLLNSEFFGFDGTHDGMLLTEIFPRQDAFTGSARVCFSGPGQGLFGAIDVLFLDIVQQGSIFQFGASPHGVDHRGCSPDTDTLCLEDGRFRVEVDWRDNPSSSLDPALGLTLDRSSGLFFFPQGTQFDELLIKVIDGCQFNDHFWVFYGATTNVEFTVTVTDTVTNLTQEYANMLGNPAPAVTDTTAFATCP